MAAVQTGRPLSKLLTVGGFVAVFVVGFVFLWDRMEAPVPGFMAEDEYQVTFRSTDVKNLKEGSPVSIAGVDVGTVTDEFNRGSQTEVTLELSDDVAPLHDGATVRIGIKGLVGSFYVGVVDGHGSVIADGTTLPKDAVKPAVDIDELLNMVDADTRAALRGTVRSLGSATKGTAGDLRALMTGLGKLGREGHTALDAIAAQSESLKSLTRETTTLLNALDTGRGQIADVVRNAHRLTEATAGQRGNLATTMRAMPALLDSTHEATGKLGELSGSLAPVAADLNRAAPDLNKALLQLPAVTSDLRGALPALRGTLDAAPATLDRIPTFGSDVRALVPGADLMLRDVNPMLAYLQPYGRDIGAMFANFGASKDVLIDGVRPVRLAPIFNSATFRGNPLPITADPLHWNNPYPEPGTADDPAPFKGEYPRVEREPK